MRPILFHVGSFAVHTYGVVLMLAAIVSIRRAWRVAQRRQDPALRPDDVVDLGFWMMFAGIVGARVLFVILEWTSYRGHATDALKLWEGGLSFHGCLAGGLLAMIAFCRRKRIPLLVMGDVYAPSIMIGYAIGRFGCFLNGCCYGGPTGLPWACQFEEGNGHLTPPSHPTQLYAVLLSLLFFAVLVRLEKRQTFAGQIMFWYILLAAAERFVMEIWRVGTTSSGLIYGLTDVQWLCAAMAVVAVAGLRRLGARPAPPRPAKTLEAVKR